MAVGVRLPFTPDLPTFYREHKQPRNSCRPALAGGQHEVGSHDGAKTRSKREVQYLICVNPCASVVPSLRFFFASPSRFRAFAAPPMTCTKKESFRRGWEASFVFRGLCLEPRPKTKCGDVFLPVRRHPDVRVWSHAPGTRINYRLVVFFVVFLVVFLDDFLAAFFAMALVTSFHSSI